MASSSLLFSPPIPSVSSPNPQRIPPRFSTPIHRRPFSPSPTASRPRSINISLALAESNAPQSADKDSTLRILLQELADSLDLPSDYFAKLPRDLRLDLSDAAFDLSNGPVIDECGQDLGQILLNLSKSWEQADVSTSRGISSKFPSLESSLTDNEKSAFGKRLVSAGRRFTSMGKYGQGELERSLGKGIISNIKNAKAARKLSLYSLGVWGFNLSVDPVKNVTKRDYRYVFYTQKQDRKGVPRIMVIGSSTWFASTEGNAEALYAGEIASAMTKTGNFLSATPTVKSDVKPKTESRTLKFGDLQVELTPEKALAGAAISFIFGILSWALAQGIRSIPESSLQYANDNALLLAKPLRGALLALGYSSTILSEVAAVGLLLLSRQLGSEGESKK